MSSADKYKVYGNVFDRYTINNLNRLSARHLFDELKSPISIGKEANIFSAENGSSEQQIIVKIYRLQSCNFNKMYDYLCQDPRFVALKKQKRKIVFAWTQREYRNILKARELGVAVPRPLEILDNILLLEYIGDPTSSEIAPKLKDLDYKSMNRDDLRELYNDVVQNMIKLHDGGLVHGDLSEFNILYHDGQVIFIDFSQATTEKSSDYKELLDRDVRNIVTFFKRKGLSVTESDLKNTIFKR